MINKVHLLFWCPRGRNSKIKHVWLGAISRWVSIEESGKWVGGCWVWELKWKRELFEWEKGLVNDLLVLISGVTPCVGKKDRWNWTAAKSGSYTTNSAYSLIAASKAQDPSPQALNKALAKVWDVPAPHKARVTAWRCLRNRLATCDNLVKRQLEISVEETKCNACISSEETADHLFLLCPKATMVWDSIFSWLGVSTVRPRDIVQHFTSFCHFGRGKKCVKILKALWTGIIWILWKNRNESRFEGKPWDVKRMVLEVKGRMWSWIKTFEISGVDVSFDAWCSGDFLLSSCIKF
ncbi:uncharacterized protein LOC130993814 [Salvia miltiorrhiza]|uniref:uncharacterized protein LOC130993814 n=1 Tax=Salvia miltiorrhiza TaxID=226208 RepID=UPI0025AC7341|nr:uncharacterized protein LOC130993814 [Salvia miltiorrhiza]